MTGMPGLSPGPFPAQFPLDKLGAQFRSAPTLRAPTKSCLSLAEELKERGGQRLLRLYNEAVAASESSAGSTSVSALHHAWRRAVDAWWVRRERANKNAVSMKIKARHTPARRKEIERLEARVAVLEEKLKETRQVVKELTRVVLPEEQ